VAAPRRVTCLIKSSRPMRFCNYQGASWQGLGELSPFAKFSPPPFPLPARFTSSVLPPIKPISPVSWHKWLFAIKTLHFYLKIQKSPTPYSPQWHWHPTCPFLPSRLQPLDHPLFFRSTCTLCFTNNVVLALFHPPYIRTDHYWRARSAIVTDQWVRISTCPCFTKVIAGYENHSVVMYGF